MRDNLRSFILEDDFRIIILENKINVMNYLEMGHFDNTRVSIRYKKNNRVCNLIIKGKNLVVSKLKSKEVLINGIINTLEFR